MRRLILLSLCLLPAIAMANSIEEPAWALVDEIGDVELRRYEPSIQARTTLKHSGETSSGFRRLAGYIFGDNDTGQKIAMTAPVGETLAGDNPVMSFTMPSAYAMDDLPEPKDGSVSLHEVPERTLAAIRFSGWATDGKVKRYTRALLATLEENGIEITGTPGLNQYNPPWTPPFMRRNEIAVEVALD
jgi:hypothetical protein